MSSSKRALQVVLLAGLTLGVVGCRGTSKPGVPAGSGGASTNGGAAGPDGAVPQPDAPSSLGTGGAAGTVGSADASGPDLSAGGVGGALPYGGSPDGRAGQGGGGSSAGGGTIGPGGGHGGGGMAMGGSAAGGLPGSGGRSDTGGAPGTGGASTTGGSNGHGGSPGTGGAPGGSPGSGGTPGSGGSSGSGGNGGNGIVISTWDFATDSEGWLGDFSDYPPNSGTGYDLQYRWSALPTELGPGGGLLMSGNNHSDDLFMYIKHPIAGLAASAQYLLDLTVTLDSNAPATCGGIGGSPGESVFVKIGAVSFEPLSTVNSAGTLTMNLDKGNQSVGGSDMKVVGTISNTLACPNTTYQAKTLTLSGFPVRSSGDGSLWLVIGTDSGFEGITTLYYDQVSATLTPHP